MNKNKIIVILSIVLGVVVIATILGVIIYKYQNKYIRFYEFDISECINKECNQTYNFNKNTLNITNDKDNNYIIKINDVEKFVGSQGFPKLGNKIYTLDDLVLFEHILTDIVKNYMIIPINGEDTVISSLKDDYNMLPTDLEIKDILDDKGKVKGKELIIYGSNFENENTFIYGYTPNTRVILNSCKSYEENKDKVVSGIYKIEYIKNNKFNKIEKISETKLEDYKKKDFSKLCEDN